MDASDALDMWESAGEIEPELARRLRASLAAHAGPERANRIIYVLVSIGAVLIGGGLLLFIASQWDQSSPVRRLLLLLAVYAVTVAGAALCDRQRLHTTASGLWFLSSLAVGANIFLVGQIFDLPLNYWQGTLLWLIATLAMGWAAPSSAQGWLAVPLGVLTLGWIATPTSQFFEQGEFLISSASLRPVLPVLGLGLLAIGGLVVGTDAGWLTRPARVFGALFVALPLTVSTFHPLAFAWLFQLELRLIHVAVFVVVGGLVAASWHRSSSPLLGSAFVGLTAGLSGILPQVADREQLVDGSSVPWLAAAFDRSELLFGVYTVVMFGLAVAVIVVGLRIENRLMIDLGFAAVSVMLLALYLGRIAGALPTSLAVILGGLLLVGGAVFLERKRREVSAGIDREELV